MPGDFEDLVMLMAGDRLRAYARDWQDREIAAGASEAEAVARFNAASAENAAALTLILAEVRGHCLTMLADLAPPPGCVRH